MIVLEDRSAETPPTRPDTPTQVRRARADDQSAIEALIRSERLNPTEIAWINFWVAARGPELVGAVQLRLHTDGSRELGSLIVRQDKRGGSLGRRLVAHLLDGRSEPIFAVTRRGFAAYFDAWGFAPRLPWRAPWPVFKNYLLGQVLGGLHACLNGRRPARLVVLRRPGGRDL
jgi:amino-acid N-acetyltransferase